MKAQYVTTFSLLIVFAGLSPVVAADFRNNLR